jgi:hypothetical protein
MGGMVVVLVGSLVNNIKEVQVAQLMVGGRCLAPSIC